MTVVAGLEDRKPRVIRQASRDALAKRWSKRIALSAAIGGLIGHDGTASAALVHQYTFNDNTAADSVGSANGTLVNGAATGSATISGGALNTVFGTTASDNFVSLPAGAVAGISGDFTIEQFVTIGATQTNFANFFTLGDGGKGTLRVQLGNPASAGRLALAVNQNNGFTSFVNTTSTATISTGTVHAIAVTSVASTNAFTLYLDGVSIATSAAEFDLSATPSGTATNAIGARKGTDPDITGSTDEFRIYDSALSARQLADSFADGPVPVPEPAGLSLACAAWALLLNRRQRRAKVDVAI